MGIFDGPDAREERAMALLRAADPSPGPDAVDPAASARLVDRVIAGSRDDAPRAAAPRARRLAPVAAAAAVTALVLGGVAGVEAYRAPAAQAREALSASADAVAGQPGYADLAVDRLDHQRRTDVSPSGVSTTTATSMGVSGTAVVRVSGPDGAPVEPGPDAPVAPGPDGTAAVRVGGGRIPLADAAAAPADPAVLATWLDSRGDRASAALDLLAAPGLPGAVRRAAYRVLADGDARVIGEAGSGEARDVTLQVPVGGGDHRGDASVTVIPATGQLTRVARPDGSVTTIDAVGVLGCVDLGGTAGPRDLTLACADANAQMTGVTWTGWGSAEARGSGVALMNDCDPSCAESELRPYPARIVADRRRECGWNLPAYTRFTIVYPEDGPEPAAAVDHREVFEIDCG